MGFWGPFHTQIIALYFWIPKPYVYLLRKNAFKRRNTNVKVLSVPALQHQVHIKTNTQITCVHIQYQHSYSKRKQWGKYGKIIPKQDLNSQGKHWTLSLHVYHLGHTKIECELPQNWRTPPLQPCCRPICHFLGMDLLSTWNFPLQAFHIPGISAPSKTTHWSLLIAF
jgi:hypothetical protein